MAHNHICMRCQQEIPCLSPAGCHAGEKVKPRLVVKGSDGQHHLFEHVCVGVPDAPVTTPSVTLDHSEVVFTFGSDEEARRFYDRVQAVNQA